MKQSHLDLLTVFLAETIATGLLVFLGCMGCVSGPHFVPTHLTICLNFGLAVMLILNIFGMVSGGHLNPAVTLAAVVYKAISIPVIKSNNLMNINCNQMNFLRLESFIASDNCLAVTLAMDF